MEQKYDIRSGYDMIYLASCTLHKKTPATERIVEMDFAGIYRLSRFHKMESAVYIALDGWIAANGNDQGTIPPDILQKWKEDHAKAIRKCILFEGEREALFTFMEERNIWHMPLKGVVLQEFYPVYGMRQMVDNDILFDRQYRKEVRDYFLERGYTAEEQEDESHDVYMKAPFFNFEMHFQLYRKQRSPVLYAYYQNVKERLWAREGTVAEYCFTAEDFYIYCVSHSYAHFMSAGIGVRSLMDTYVYLAAMEEQLDTGYIQKECAALGIEAYEESTKQLAGKLFADTWGTYGITAECLTEEEQETVAFYIFSGSHGTREHYVVQKMRACGKMDEAITWKQKVQYLFRRIYPDDTYYKRWYPFVYKHKFLKPAVAVYRCIKALILYPGRLWAEWKLVLRTKK